MESFAAGGRGQKHCWAGGGTKYAPARPVGISVSAGAKPGAGAAPHPPTPRALGKGSFTSLHLRSTRANSSSLPTIRERPNRCRGRGGGPLAVPPNPRGLSKSKGPVSQEKPCPQAPAPRIRRCPPLNPGRTQPPPLPDQAAPPVPQRPTRVGQGVAPPRRALGEAVLAACHVGPGPGLRDWGGGNWGPWDSGGSEAMTPGDRELLAWGGGVNRADGFGESRTISFGQFQSQSQMG